MSRKAKYTGGAWAVGGVRGDRPAIDGRASAARILQRLRRLENFEDHARQRAAENAGTAHGAIWSGMVTDYAAERDRLETLLQRKQQRAAA